MPTRTIETSPDVEGALAFLSKEKKSNPDQYLLDKLGSLFDALVKESNQKKYDQAMKLLESKDPAKVIPGLKALLD